MEIYSFVFTYSETQLKVSKSKRAETKETREGVLCYLNVKRGFGGKVEGLNFFFFFFHLQCDDPTASALQWKMPSSWRLLFGSGLPPALF